MEYESSPPPPKPSLLTAIGNFFRGWWRWASKGTAFQRVVAIGGAVVVIGLVLNVVIGGSDNKKSEPNAIAGLSIAPTSRPAVSSPTPTAARTATATGPTTTAVVLTPQATPAATQGTAAAPTATAVPPTPAIYKVASGDTLTGIATKLAIPGAQQAAWMQQVLTMNGIADARLLAVGQDLKLPTSSPGAAPSQSAQAGATPQGAAPSAAASAPVSTQAPANSGTLTVSSLTSPVSVGGNATLRAMTTPGASCSISYAPASGTNSRADGLVPKVADGTGVISWTWEIGPGTGRGPGSVRVSCAGQTVTREIVIQ
jgi:LysM repeat protein